VTDQKFVYTTHATQTRSNKMNNIESVINAHASEGWRLSETLERDGTTVGLVFERRLE